MSSSLKIDFREEGKILFLKKVQEVRKHAENVRLEALTPTRWLFRGIFCTIFPTWLDEAWMHEFFRKLSADQVRMDLLH